MTALRRADVHSSLSLLRVQRSFSFLPENYLFAPFGHFCLNFQGAPRENNDLQCAL